MIQDTNSVNKWGWLYAILFVIVLIIVIWWITRTNNNKSYVSKDTDKQIFSICRCPDGTKYYENATGNIIDKSGFYVYDPNYDITNGCSITLKPDTGGVKVDYNEFGATAEGNKTYSWGQTIQGPIPYPASLGSDCQFDGAITLAGWCGQACN